MEYDSYFKRLRPKWHRMTIDQKTAIHKKDGSGYIDCEIDYWDDTGKGIPYSPTTLVQILARDPDYDWSLHGTNAVLREVYWTPKAGPKAAPKVDPKAPPPYSQ